jgi:hypothetical protein
MFSLLIKATLLGQALAWPAALIKRNYPPDGFPNPSSSQVQQIEQTALGTLANGPPPPSGAISADGITNLQLINLNENFEVYFFTSLVNNITNNVTGFEFSDPKERAFALKALTTILAVSLIHGPYNSMTPKV